MSAGSTMTPVGYATLGIAHQRSSQAAGSMSKPKRARGWCVVMKAEDT
jgi:hypothetical protein